MSRSLATLLIAALVAIPILAYSEEPAQKDERSAKEKEKSQTEKKGALKERVDPAKDIQVQKANVRRLERNAEIERANGNRVGAWAAEGDAKHARKLLDKDRKLLEKGEQKQQVDEREVKK